MCLFPTSAIFSRSKNPLKGYGDLESKFRFVILASMRAKQLLRGAKPKIKTKSKNLIRIAQQEVHQGLIDYEFVERKADELDVEGEDMFIGEEIEGSDLGIGEPFSIEDLRKKVGQESPEEEAIRKAVLESVKKRQQNDLEADEDEDLDSDLDDEEDDEEEEKDIDIDDEEEN
jgi:DNA-directed RNA polymerase subunit K/omega